MRIEEIGSISGTGTTPDGRKAQVTVVLVGNLPEPSADLEVTVTVNGEAMFVEKYPKLLGGDTGPFPIVTQTFVRAMQGCDHKAATLFGAVPPGKLTPSTLLQELLATLQAQYLGFLSATLERPQAVEQFYATALRAAQTMVDSMKSEGIECPMEPRTAAALCVLRVLGQEKSAQHVREMAAVTKAHMAVFRQPSVN